MLDTLSSDSLVQGVTAASTIDPLDYWRLCDRLSVVQAAMLIVGQDPGEPWHNGEPQGYRAAVVALERAIRAGNLPADDDFEFHEYYTTVAVDDLRNWLRSRGVGRQRLSDKMG